MGSRAAWRRLLRILQFFVIQLVVVEFIEQFVIVIQFVLVEFVQQLQRA